MPAYKVANPAVIIGLGGTGRWILTYIKKNLLDTYDGSIPKGVRLLSFDTAQEKVSREAWAPEEEARVGDVQLDRSESVYLGGNIRRLCFDIRDKQAYPHIGSWLQADSYLKTVDPDAFDISRGAGQKRPFGRMALFYDLRSKMQSEFTNRIRQAIIDTAAASDQNQTIEIYIVGSVAGGTGGGMLLDTAHLARWFASHQLRSGFAVRGFIVLQNTFRSVIDVRHVEANTAAALRELDRFMLAFDQPYPLIYNPDDPELTTLYGGQTGKLFDNCYLIDAARENLSFENVSPKYSTYPLVADCITTLLDASTGDAYAQHYKNVNTRIADAQRTLNQPIYSSLGSHSLILPVEDIITSLSYRFVRELLSCHLLLIEPIKEASASQVLLASDHRARGAALDFLRSQRSTTGIETTTFISRIPMLMDHNIEDLAYQRELAQTSTSDLMVWLLPPEGEPIAAEIANEVRKIIERRLVDYAPPSDLEGDDYASGCERIARLVAQFKDDALGAEYTGRPSGGRYRTALERCVELQRQRYCQLLQEWLLGTLNGSNPDSPDFQHQRRGQLGFVQQVLGQLNRTIDQLIALLDTVRSYRAQTNDLRLRRDRASQQRDEMNRVRLARSFVGSVLRSRHPTAQAQRSYLDAEQDLIDYETNDLLLEHLRLAAVALLNVTEEHKAAVDAWVSTLATGYAGSIIDPGLYRSLLAAETRHQTHRAEKRRIVVHEYLTDEAYEDTLYRTYATGKHEAALATMVWSLDQTVADPQLRLPHLSVVTSERLQSRSVTERNLEVMLKLAQSYFTAVRELTVIERLAQLDPAATLALRLAERCGPMLRFDPQRQGMHELSRFVCINEGRERGFMNDFMRAFRAMGSQSKDNQVLSAASSYTCTVLATADVIVSSGTLPYIAAEEAYNRYQGDARLLHIFPAEVNAVALEQELPRINEPRRKFHPRLTALLEDRKRVELFTLCFLYEFVSLETVGSAQGRYVLSYPAADHRDTRDTGRFELTHPSNTPSLFLALETFVGGQLYPDAVHVRIDVEQTERALRIYEAALAGARINGPHGAELLIEGGDDSRLINLLSKGLRRGGQIDEKRRSKDPLERDLGSLMALIVSHTIDDLHRRLRLRSQQYDERAEPLLPRAPVLETVVSPVSGPVSANGSAAERRAKLERAFQDGVLTQAELDAKLKELERASLPVPDERRAKLERAFQDGVLTLEEYQAKLRALE